MKVSTFFEETHDVLDEGVFLGFACNRVAGGTAQDPVPRIWIGVDVPINHCMRNDVVVFRFEDEHVSGIAS